MTDNSRKERSVTDESKLFEVSSEQVYVYIVPYLDSNVIYLTHNKKENNNPVY
jgi:hypothetical protein